MLLEDYSVVTPRPPQALMCNTPVSGLTVLPTPDHFLPFHVAQLQLCPPNVSPPSTPTRINLFSLLWGRSIKKKKGFSV